MYRLIQNSRNPKFVYVLTRNERDEAELVDEYVGMIVQKLCKGKHMSSDLIRSQQWL